MIEFTAEELATLRILISYEAEMVEGMLALDADSLWNRRPIEAQLAMKRRIAVCLAILAKFGEEAKS